MNNGESGVNTSALPETISCTFCGQSQDKCKKIVMGPKPCAICDTCIASLHDKHKNARCSFCGKLPDEVGVIITEPTNICYDCLSMCVDILEECDTEDGEDK